MKIEEYFDNLSKYNNNFSNKKYETNKFINFSRSLLELQEHLPNDIIKKIDKIDRENIKESNFHKTNKESKSNQPDKDNIYNAKHSSNMHEVGTKVNESDRVFIFPSVRKL